MNYLIGIGAQKAGTTWLHHYFSAHPQIAPTPLKEMHFFDQIYRSDVCGYFLDNFKNQYKILLEKQHKGEISHSDNSRLLHLEKRIRIANNHDKYREYLNSLTTPTKLTAVDITPSYSLLNEDGFSAIKNTLPNAKILFVMRDPINRYWSQLRFHHMMQPAFDPVKNIELCLTDPHFYERSNYAKTIRGLEDVFDAKNICYIFYEDLMSPDKHAQTILKITDFLNVDPANSHLNNQVNKSISLTLPHEKLPQLKSAFASTYRAINTRFGKKVPKKWVHTATNNLS